MCFVNTSKKSISYLIPNSLILCNSNKELILNTKEQYSETVYFFSIDLLRYIYRCRIIIDIFSFFTETPFPHYNCWIWWSLRSHICCKFFVNYLWIVLKPIRHCLFSVKPIHNFSDLKSVTMWRCLKFESPRHWVGWKSNFGIKNLSPQISTTFPLSTDRTNTRGEKRIWGSQNPTGS